MKITILLSNNTIVEHADSWITKRRKIAYAPATLKYLASLVPTELNAEINIIDEGIDILNIDEINANIVGISVMTPNALRAYKISEKLRNKGITVVLGGVHVSLMPDEAQKYADAIVIGYAERSWPQLLLDFKNNTLKKTYNLPYN